MPCMDPDRDKYELETLRKRLDQVTRSACDMRTIIRRHQLEHELTVEARRWITQHDKADAERIAREQAAGQRQRARQAALDKLTLEDRRILGL